MVWHKLSGETIYDNISGPAGPIMSNINGPPDHLWPDQWRSYTRANQGLSPGNLIA